MTYWFDGLSDKERHDAALHMLGWLSARAPREFGTALGSALDQVAADRERAAARLTR